MLTAQYSLRYFKERNSVVAIKSFYDESIKGEIAQEHIKGVKVITEKL